MTGTVKVESDGENDGDSDVDANWVCNAVTEGRSRGGSEREGQRKARDGGRIGCLRDRRKAVALCSGQLAGIGASTCS